MVAARPNAGACNGSSVYGKFGEAIEVSPLNEFRIGSLKLPRVNRKASK